MKVSGKATIKIGDFIEINGEFSTDSLGNTVVTNALVFVGAGPRLLEDGTVNPNAKGLLITAPSITLTGTTGSRVLDATGTVTLVGIPGLTFSGSVRMQGTEGATGTSKVAGNLVFGVSGLSLSGSFGFSYDKATGALTISLGEAVTASDLPSGATRETVKLGLGEPTTVGDPSTSPVYVTVTNGTFVIKNGGLVADTTVTVAFAPSTGMGASLTAKLQLNTTGATELGIAPGTIRVVAGVGSPVSISIGGQSISGIFAFEQVVVPPPANAAPGTLATKEIRVAASQLSMTIGSSTAGVVMTGGRGALVFAPGGVAATFSGGISLVVPGLTVTGSFSVAVNQSTARVSRQINVGDDTVALDLPAGPYFKVEGTGIVLDLAGQRITGNASITQTSGVTTISLTGVTASFGSGTTPIVSLTGGTANLVLGTTGVVGNFAGTVAVTLPSVSVTGTFALHIDTTGPGVLKFTGSPITIVVAGQTLVVTTVELTQVTDATGAKTTTVNLTDAKLTLAGFGVVTVSGNLVASPTGVAGRLSVSAGLTFGEVSLTGTLRMSINSGTQSVLVAGVPIPAGPYLRIDSATQMTLTIGTIASLSGSFSVEQATSSTGAKRTVLAASGVIVTINGNELLSNVQGVLVIVPAGPGNPGRPGRQRLRDGQPLQPAPGQRAGLRQLRARRQPHPGRRRGDGDRRRRTRGPRPGRRTVPADRRHQRGALDRRPDPHRRRRLRAGHERRHGRHRADREQPRVLAGRGSGQPDQRLRQLRDGQLR